MKMPRTKQLNKYNLYRQILHQKSKSGHYFSCRDCSMLVLPAEYETHCKQMHGLKTNVLCVWCRNFSWPSRKKQFYSDHLTQCFRKFIVLDSTPIHPTAGIRLASLEHECQQEYLYNFSKLPTPEYKNLWPLKVKEHPLCIRDDENINLAMSYVSAYFELKNRCDFIHVMIRAFAFESFVQALNEGKVKTLKFSCWCNGGEQQKKLEYRQHRHLVVVARKGHFKKVFWPKVKSPSQSSKVRCKVYKMIETPMHLVHTLGYLSHRHSTCKFSFESVNNNETAFAGFDDDFLEEYMGGIVEKTPENMNHFYIYKTLPKSYNLILSLLWKGGLKELLYIRKFQNVSVLKLIKQPFQYLDGEYRQQIKHFYNHEQNIVLPVEKRFMATKQATPIYLHLMGGKKLYFKSCDEQMDDDTWILNQKMGGNSFFDNIEEGFWTPRPRDQKTLNILVPKVEENDQLKAKNDQLQTKCYQLQIKCDQIQTEKDQIQTKCDQIQTKCDQIQTEKDQIQTKYDKLQTKYEQLQSENYTLKRKYETPHLVIAKHSIISLNAKSENFTQNLNN